MIADHPISARTDLKLCHRTSRFVCLFSLFVYLCSHLKLCQRTSRFVCLFPLFVHLCSHLKLCHNTSQNVCLFPMFVSLLTYVEFVFWGIICLFISLLFTMFVYVLTIYAPEDWID